MSDSTDFVVLVPYNGSATGTGGDSLAENLNVFYNVGDPKVPLMRRNKAVAG
jgi:hypothetical protein